MMKLQQTLMMSVALASVLIAQAVASELFPQSAPRTGPVVGLIDEVQEFYPDTKCDTPAKRLVMHAARNTTAAVHVMIAGLRGTETIRFAESDMNGRPGSGIRWYRMIDVPVLENTGLDRNTEKYSGKINPYVIRRAPFRIYDPFRPVTSPTTADSTSLALRMEVPVEATCPPGEYTHRIIVTCDGIADTLAFVVVVHRAAVPPLSGASLSYINWHSLDNICSSHGVEKWSEPFWTMLGKYARMMAHGRQNAFWFIWAEYFTFDSAGHVTEFRRDRLERYIRLFLNEGLTTIHGAPIVGRRDWFGSQDMLLGVRPADGREVHADSAPGRMMLTEMLVPIAAMMKENHWEGEWLQGIFDEPTDEFVVRYKELVGLFRHFAPGIKILEATMTVNVTGDVDVWCPQVQEYQANREFFDRRKAAGDKVWVYTCLSPGGPWLNRLLDEERLRQVYIGWACSKYNLQGYLHWGLNHHTSKPFEELVRFHMEGQFLPAGDSHILYPVREGPLSSHRFEAHRIGMEDFELLAQLKLHDAARADQIIGRVVQGFDKYSKDVAEYRTARKLLLDAVDAYAVK